jgi:hypothetical protein
VTLVGAHQAMANWHSGSAQIKVGGLSWTPDLGPLAKV